MTKDIRDTVIQDGTAITGRVINGRRVEVYGYVEGELAADTVLIHETGKVYGTLKAANVDVAGMFQGEAAVASLLNICASGAVFGNVQYGQLAMAEGGELSADVRNIPPEIGGDLNLAVEIGRSVKITQTDLTAHDPDDLPEHLTYTVSNPVDGFVVLSNEPARPVTQFTQADLLAGKVNFVHRGGSTAPAGFDVVVADASGGHSGPPINVTVEIKGHAQPTA